MTTATEYKYVGKPHRLIEGEEKVSGQSCYTADVKIAGMLYAHLILSPHAHAKIVSVDKSQAEALPGVVAVLTANDLITKDRTIASRTSAILAKGYVLWCGQPVVAVVAESEASARDAAEHVMIEYEVLPAVVDIEEAMKPEAPIIWPHGLPKAGDDSTAAHGAMDKTGEAKKLPNNVHKENNFARGNIEEGMAAADLILEDKFRMEMVHQGYLEPCSCVVAPTSSGKRVTVYASTQSPFDVRNQVALNCGLPKGHVKIVPMTFGGGFGAKHGMLESTAGAIALTLNKPIRIVLSRSDDFLTTTPSPLVIIHLKTGVTNEGFLTAMEAKVLMDNGIFSFNLSGIVAMMLGGLYKCDNLKIDCYEINTHKPQIGAYRAPGSPQASFAIEAHMDEIARRLNLDPIELRLQNAATEGDPSGIGRPWPPIGLRQCLQRMQAHPEWKNRTEETGVGYGLAIGGWPGAIGPAASVCRVDSDGMVNLHLGTSDISGVNSSFVLIAAEVLGVSPDEVNIVPGDTSNSPYGPASGGSKIAYSVGDAVRLAAEAAKEKLVAVAASEFEAAPEDIELVDSHAQVKGVPDQRIGIAKLVSIAESKPGGVGPIVGERSESKPINAPAFVVHLIKIKVDEETGEIQPLHYIAVQDVGFPLNPMLVEGQMHGGMAQGLGMALHEAMIYDEAGQLLTGSMLDYTLPKARMIPTIETIMLENPSPQGPYGARGVGEPPIVVGGAAIANAIRDATGVRLTNLPIRPNMVWKAKQAS